MKKPSGSSRPPDPQAVEFFTDRDLGSIIPGRLRDAGLVVHAFADHFGDPATPDHVWLKDVGARNWVVLTRDSRIRYRSQERDALMTAGVRTIVLPGKLTHTELASLLLASISRIMALLNSNDGPFIARLYRSHPHIAIKYTIEDWSSRDA